MQKRKRSKIGKVFIYFGECAITGTICSIYCAQVLLFNYYCLIPVLLEKVFPSQNLMAIFWSFLGVACVECIFIVAFGFIVRNFKELFID